MNHNSIANHLTLKVNLNVRNDTRRNFKVSAKKIVREKKSLREPIFLQLVLKKLEYSFQRQKKSNSSSLKRK